MSYPLHTRAIIGYIEAHINEGKLDYTELERRMGFSYAHIWDFFKRIQVFPWGNMFASDSCMLESLCRLSGRRLGLCFDSSNLW